MFFEFSNYIKFIKMEGHYSKIPNPVFKSLIYLVAAFAFIGINKFLEIRFYDMFVLTDEYESWSLLKKYGWMYFYGAYFRTFYYIAFMLQNGALVACGFCFNGVNP